MRKRETEGRGTQLIQNKKNYRRQSSKEQNKKQNYGRKKVIDNSTIPKKLRTRLFLQRILSRDLMNKAIQSKPKDKIGSHQSQIERGKAKSGCSERQPAASRENEEEKSTYTSRIQAFFHKTRLAQKKNTLCWIAFIADHEGVCSCVRRLKKHFVLVFLLQHHCDSNHQTKMKHCYIVSIKLILRKKKKKKITIKPNNSY